MDCEMCGKPATVVVEVEGAKLTVCAACSRYGRVVRQLPPPKATKPKVLQSAPARREETELVEQVRKDLPSILRKERERRKLTHEEFAKVLQIRASTYHHFESGIMLPDTTIARRIEHFIRAPLVVSVKVSKAPWKPGDTGKAEGLMLGNFVKKK